MANTLGDRLYDEIMENGVNAMISSAEEYEEEKQQEIDELQEKIDEQDETIKDLYARLN